MSSFLPRLASSQLRALGVAVILIAGISTYWPALHGPWLWDDNLLIVDNPLLKDPDGWWKIWFQPGVLVDYYPVTFSVMRIAWNAWGMEPTGYHVLSLALHLTSALLVWHLLGKLGLKFAFWGGLLFAVHPAVVESVAWVAELKNTLSLPPLLLSACAYIDYDECRRPRDLGLAVGFFTLSLLCKSAGVMLPVAFLLYAWWKRGKISARDVGSCAPFFMLALVTGMLGLWLAGHHPEPPANFSIDPLARVATVSRAFFFFLRMSVFPVGLTTVYPSRVVTHRGWTDLFPWTAALAVLYFSWQARARWGRHVLLALGFFSLNLVPALIYVAMKTTTMIWSLDHLVYISLIGVIGLEVLAIEALYVQVPARTRHALIPAVLCVVVVFAFGSRAYASFYGDPLALWGYNAQRNPDSATVRTNYGETLAMNGNIPGAMEQFEAAAKLDPSFRNSHLDLAKADVQLARYADAALEYQEALRINPHDDAVAYALGNTYVRLGQFPEAQAQFEKALQLNSKNFAAHYGEGGLLFGAGRLPEAIDQFRQSLALEPNHAEVHVALGKTYLKTRQWAPASEQFTQALQLNPDNAASHTNLGICLAQMKQMPAAIAEFRNAIALDPGQIQAHTNLGTTLQQTGDLEGAIQEFQAALKINPNFPDAQNKLALAIEQKKARDATPPSP